MRQITIQNLSHEAFAEYGDFFDMLNPQGHHIDALYADRIRFPVSGGMPVAFSDYVVEKRDQMIISAVEYHNETSEVMLPLDGDVIFHVAPASKTPVPEKTKAFLVPKGVMVCIHPGVWHLESYPAENDRVHILIALPERTYMRDCHMVSYGVDQQLEIVQPPVHP